MNLQKSYSALLTNDLSAAEAWYTKLFGRGPDYRPMETLVQWELSNHGGLMLSTFPATTRHLRRFAIPMETFSLSQRHPQAPFRRHDYGGSCGKA